MAFDVIGVGRAVVDHQVMIPEYPQENSKTESVARYSGGGSPVPNALCQLAKWDWKVLLAAKVGNDPDGRSLIEETAGYGVSTRRMIVSSTKLPTPRAFIWVNKQNGSRTIVLDRELDPIRPDELPFDDLKQCRILLTDGWEANACLEASKIVRNHGGKVMIDLGAERPRMDEQLQEVDWIIAPKSFVEKSYGRNAQNRAIKDLLGHGAELVVVTDGEKGCVAGWGDTIKMIPAFPADVVDTTGAGDIFHAGAIHGLLCDWSVEKMIRWASAAAALSVSGFGCRGRLAKKEEIETFLNNQE